MTDNQLGMGWGDPTGTTLPPLEGSSPEESDRLLVQDLTRIWEYEDTQRRFHERQWQRSLDRKNLIFDFSKKRPWQSRRVVPGYTLLCMKVAWELAKPVLLANGPLFEATTDLDPWRELLDIPTEILESVIKSNGENPASDLMVNWTKCMDTMADTGNAAMMIVPETDGMIDMRPDTEESIFGDDPEPLPPMFNGGPLPSLGLPTLGATANATDDMPTIDEMMKKSRIRFEAMNPMHVFVDTANPDRPTYVMWRQFLMPWQFEELAERHGWRNVEEVLKSIKHSTKTEKDARRLDHRNALVNEPVRPTDCVCVHHFIGTLPGKRGQAVFKNQYCVWSGDKILKDPADLGFWHGRLPIVYGGMLERAFSTYAQSIAVINLDPQEARNEMINSLLDYMNQIVNPPTEINHNVLHQSIGAKQLAHGLTPGGVIHTQNPGNLGPAISRSAVPDMPSGMWQGLGFFEQRLNETTGLADIGSAPRTRNRISADEAAERQAMSAGIWQKCLLNIETKFLAPILYQAWLLGLQKISEEEWRGRIQKRIDRIKSSMGQPTEMSGTPDKGADVPQDSDTQIETTSPLLDKLTKMLNWDAKTRWKKMAAAFTFTPKVFSSVESRRRGLEQMQFLIEGSAQVPGMMQSIVWPKVSENMILQLQLDPKEYIRPDAYQLPPPGPDGTPGGGAVPPGAPGPVSPVVPPPQGRR